MTRFQLQMESLRQFIAPQPTGLTGCDMPLMGEFICSYMRFCPTGYGDLSFRDYLR
jgi:hypothetical protein